MAHYQAYFIGQDGRFNCATELDCADDDAAIKGAKPLVDGHDVELWQGDRKVAVFEHKSGKPSGSTNFENS